MADLDWSWQQWTTMGNNGQQWTAMDNNGQQWVTMGDNGQQRATIGNNGQQWATMGNNGQQWATCIRYAIFWGEVLFGKSAHLYVPQKWHFGCPNKNSETTFISPTSPKIEGKKSKNICLVTNLWWHANVYDRFWNIWELNSWQMCWWW